MTSDPAPAMRLSARLLGALMALSAAAGALTLLWMGAQTRPQETSWFMPVFWDGMPYALAVSALLLGTGVRASVQSPYVATALSVLLTLGVCAGLRLWQWPAFLLVLPAVAGAALPPRYTLLKKWIGTFGIGLALWWLIVAMHEQHVRSRWAASNESPELGFAALLAGIAVTTGIPALALRFARRGRTP